MNERKYTTKGKHTSLATFALYIIYIYIYTVFFVPSNEYFFFIRQHFFRRARWTFIYFEDFDLASRARALTESIYLLKKLIKIKRGQKFVNPANIQDDEDGNISSKVVEYAFHAM